MAASTPAADVATFRTTRVRVLQATVVLAAIVLWRSALDTHATFKVAAITTGTVVLLAVTVLEAVQARSFALPRRWILAVTGVYGGALLLCTAVSDNRWRSLVGERGRGTGLLLYGTLLLLFLAVVARFDRDDIERILLAVLGSAVLVALYAILQTLHLDPWHLSSGYGAASSTLGNPNFVSAYLAIALPLAFLWVRRRREPRERYALFAAIGIIIVGIVAAKSAQGFLAAGLGCLLPGWLFVSRLPRQLRASVLGAIGGFAVVAVGVVGLGALGTGPLKGQLGHAGRDQRVAFWQAGTEMLGDHPVLGVGLDGYGRFYRQYRSQDEALQRGVFDAADEPHSVPLGMFVGGGIVLGLAYLAFVLGIGAVLLIGLRNPPDDALMLYVVGGAWIAYQVQSAISIDAPPLPLLHLLLAASIVVLAGQHTVRSWRAPARRTQRRRAPAVAPLPGGVVAGVVIGSVIVLSFTLRPVIAELRAASGVRAERHGHPNAAIDALQSAHSFLPREPAFEAELGKALAASRGPQAGLASYRAAVKADDRALTSLLPLARLADAAGSVEEARDAYRRAAVVDPVAPEIVLEEAKFELRHRNPNEALALYAKVEKVRPRTTDDELAIADAYTLLGRTDDAAKLYDKVLTELPRNVDLRTVLGENAMKTKQYDRARTLFQEALAIDPGRGHLWYDLGLALEGLGDPAGALKAYREAVLRPPGDPGLGPAMQRVGGG